MAFEGMEAYEARAAEAERRLDALEKRLEEGGGAQDGAGQGGAMSGEKLSAVLTTLYNIRQTLGKETHKQMMAERERIKLEETMSKLSEENAKLQYQVLHLKRNLQAQMAS